jgi:hypothetical protein
VNVARIARTKSLSSLLPKEAKVVFRKYGFSSSEVLTRWADVVGPDMAKHTEPIRFQFQKGKRGHGTLHLKVEGSFAPALQHLAPLLMEKVNMFYGYKVVGKITIIQGPVDNSDSVQKPKKPILISQKNKRNLDLLLEDTKDPELRSVLEGLGKSILSDTV